jgi:hypothetical protein
MALTIFEGDAGGGKLDHLTKPSIALQKRFL